MSEKLIKLIDNTLDDLKTKANQFWADSTFTKFRITFVTGFFDNTAYSQIQKTVLLNEIKKALESKLPLDLDYLGLLGLSERKKYIKELSSLPSDDIKLAYNMGFDLVNFADLVAHTPKDKTDFLLYAISNNKIFSSLDSVASSLIKEDWKHLNKKALKSALLDYFNYNNDRYNSEHIAGSSQEYLLRALKSLMPNDYQDFLLFFTKIPEKKDITSDMFHIGENAVVSLSISTNNIYHTCDNVLTYKKLCDMVQSSVELINSIAPDNINNILISSKEEDSIKLIVQSRDTSTPNVIIVQKMLVGLFEVLNETYDIDYYDDMDLDKAAMKIYLDNSIEHKPQKKALKI